MGINIYLTVESYSVLKLKFSLMQVIFLRYIIEFVSKRVGILQIMKRNS
jgi:hypothetical protein